MKISLSTIKSKFQIIEIGNNSHITPEGYLKCSGILCKSGIVDYNEEILLITKEALQTSIESWNGQPVTYLHEFQDVENNNSIGNVFNVHTDEQDGEILLLGDIKIMDKDIIQSILQGENQDISIGFYRDKVDNKPGVYKGKSYTSKILSLIPNHIAICPNNTARVDDAKIVFNSNKKIQEGNMPNSKDFKNKKTALSQDEEENENVLNEDEESENVESESNYEERFSKIENTLGLVMTAIEEISSLVKKDQAVENSEIDEEFQILDEASFSKNPKVQEMISHESQKIAIELNRVQNLAKAVGVSFSLTDGIQDIKSKVIEKKLPFTPGYKPSALELSAQFNAAIAFSKKEIEFIEKNKDVAVGFAQVDDQNPQQKFTKNRIKAKDFK